MCCEQPSESKYANIGISLPGIREEPAPVYMDGALVTTLRGDNITQEFMEIMEAYIKNRYQKMLRNDCLEILKKM